MSYKSGKQRTYQQLMQEGDVGPEVRKKLPYYKYGWEPVTRSNNYLSDYVVKDNQGNIVFNSTFKEEAETIAYLLSEVYLQGRREMAERMKNLVDNRDKHRAEVEKAEWAIAKALQEGL